LFSRQPQRDGDTEHHRQEAEGKGADFAHPDKDRLQHGIPSHGISVMTSLLLSELPIPSMIPQNESNATGSIKVFPVAGKIPTAIFFVLFSPS
jgi:hypothetical protein